MKKIESKPYDPNATWRAIYEFVNLMLDAIEEERGKIWLIQYFAEVKLRNALNWIVYGPDNKSRNSLKKSWRGKI